MNAREFIDTYGSEEAKRVAESAGTNLDYFRQIANGHRNASLDLAERLVAASDGKLNERELVRAVRNRKEATNAA